MPRVMLKLDVVDSPPRKIWFGLKLPLHRLMKKVNRMNTDYF